MLRKRGNGDRLGRDLLGLLVLMLVNGLGDAAHERQADSGDQNPEHYRQSLKSLHHAVIERQSKGRKDLMSSRSK